MKEKNICIRIMTLILLLGYILQLHAGTIIFSYNYEDGAPQPGHSTAGDGTYTNVTSPTLPNSTRAMKHYIANSDERVEIRGIDNGLIGSGEDWWYALSYYFPNGWHTSIPGQPDYTILNQVGYQGASNDQKNCRTNYKCNPQRENGKCSRGAPASHLTINPQCTEFKYTANYYAYTTSDNRSIFECQTTSFPAGLDQWHTLVWHIITADQPGEGLIELYHQRKLVFTVNNPIFKPGSENGEWKYGAYVGDPNHGTRTVYTDEFYAGRDYANIDSFLADTPYGTNNSTDPVIPTAYCIYPNYPNPFNPETHFRIDLPVDSPVKISIFNIEGQKVKTLVDQIIGKGIYQVTWNASDDQDRSISSGVYFYKINIGNSKTTGKMLFMQ